MKATCPLRGEHGLEPALERGWYVSFAGNVTYKNAADLRLAATQTPANRLLAETDCPYLAPVPMRGRRNEPAFLPHILTRLAEIRGWSAEEAELRTEEAFFALFDRIPRS